MKFDSRDLEFQEILEYNELPNEIKNSFYIIKNPLRTSKKPNRQTNFVKYKN